MDFASCVMANRLVGNPPGAAVLESTFGGASIEFPSPASVAVTGALVEIDLNGFPMPLGETLVVPEGSTLTLSHPSSGLYSYVAVGGGVGVPSVLGSRSTHIASGVGGSALYVGDLLPIGDLNEASPIPLPGSRAPEESMILGNEGDSVIRATTGPQHNEFDVDANAAFFGATYTVSNLTDRQGARLGGEPISTIDGKHDIVSDPAYMGAVQIPADGQPIILLADRQTTGGYVKIASVIAADLPVVAQLQPGSILTFSEVDVAEAQELSRAYLDFVYNEPLTAPPNRFSFDGAVDRKPVTVELATPSSADALVEGDGILFASVNGAPDVAVAVERLD